MPLITRLEVDGFRCFKKLCVDGLSRVNAFVGKNNSGKTALLEAVEAVVSENSPFLLYRASMERGESRLPRRSAGRAEMVTDVVELDIRHWFHGHRLEEGTAYSLRAAGERSSPSCALSSGCRPTRRLPHSFRTASSLRSNGLVRAPPLLTLPLGADGFLGVPGPIRVVETALTLRPPVSFITTRRLLAAELSLLWQSVVLTPREDAAVAALRLVEPTVERVAVSGNGDSAVAQVLLRGATGPVPLGTLGEGVSRIFALALHLAETQGGFLLVDEIENGLHWSVMPTIWRFLVETARALDVQIFATTHSKDCLEAVAELHRSQPDLAGDISVHRLEAGRETPVRFDASRIAEYIDMKLETR